MMLTKKFGIIAAICLTMLLVPCMVSPVFAEGSHVVVSNYTGLSHLIEQYNSGAIDEDVTVVLGDDIEVPDSVGNDWIPLGTEEHPFQGMFDGNGCTISGINISRTYPDPWDGETPVYNYSSLISFLGENGRVQNLAVDASINDVNDVAGIVSQNYGTIISCTFSGELKGQTYANEYNVDAHHTAGRGGKRAFNAQNSEVGGIAALNMGAIENCRTTSGTRITKGNCRVGGICGFMGTGAISECQNKAEIVNVHSHYGSEAEFNAAGGIVGISGVSSNTTEEKPLIEKCLNEGSVKTVKSGGGIVGIAYATDMDQCTNEGTVQIQTANENSDQAGGIAGGFKSEDEVESTLSNCVNKGLVTATDTELAIRMGGIVGYAMENMNPITKNTTPIHLINCVNEGTVDGGVATGGIFGRLENARYGNDVYVYGMINTGDIQGQNQVGGIAGDCPGILMDCINYGKVTSEWTSKETENFGIVGGIIGDAYNTGIANACYNYGSVSGKVSKSWIKVYAGGIAGYSSKANKNSYFCVDTAGDAQYAMANIPNEDFGGLTLSQITGVKALDNMSALTADPRKWDHHVTWESVANVTTDAAADQTAGQAVAKKTYFMTPQIEGMKYTAAELMDAGVDLKSLEESAVTKITRGKKRLTVKWKKAADVNGYQIQLCRSSKFNKSVKKRTVKSYSSKGVTVKSLSKGKKYYVRVRTYEKVGNSTVYSNWSAVKTGKTK